ncbi:MAG: hypothetical protein ACP6IU_09730 [Candidatus Asgardarchaeia archaeon]
MEENKDKINLEKQVLKVISESQGIHIRLLYKKTKTDVKKLFEIIQRLISKGYIIEKGKRAYRYYFVTDDGIKYLGKADNKNIEEEKELEKESIK